MTYIDSLKTARDNYASELATESADPKPTYSIDGQTVQWDAYRASLTSKIKEANELIEQGEGYEVTSIGYQ